MSHALFWGWFIFNLWSTTSFTWYFACLFVLSQIVLLGFVTNSPLVLVCTELHPGFAAACSSNPFNLKFFPHLLWGWRPPILLSFWSYFRSEETVSTVCKCSICLPPFTALVTLMKLLGNGAGRWREAKSVPLNWLGVEEGLAEAVIVPSWWPQSGSSPRPAPDLIWPQESIRDLWPSLKLRGVLSPGIPFSRKSFNSVLALWTSYCLSIVESQASC